MAETTRRGRDQQRGGDVSNEEPFFHRSTEPGRFDPTDIARGPWGHETLHGHVLGGLIAHVIEEEHGDPDFVPARFTVDMFRPPQFAPVVIKTSVARAGNRVKVIDASLEAGDVEIARGSALMLRRAEDPPGSVWSPEPWDAPLPASLPETTGDRAPVWETRFISGLERSAERRSAWMREVRALVDGSELTPWVRSAMAADFTNPLANSGDAGLEFVNADYTLYLHRLPVGEWIGVQATSHHSADGVAVASCALYDEGGPIGRSAVGAVANRR